MTDLSDHPTVTLAGKQYPVKPLVLRQLRIVVPAVMRLKSINLAEITEQQIDDLAEIAYQAVAPSQQPPLSRDAFLGMAVTPMELIESLPVVARQSGMMKDASPGEAAGAAGPPTGTKS